MRRRRPVAVVFVVGLFISLLIGTGHMAGVPWLTADFPSSGGKVVEAQTVSSLWYRTFGGGDHDGGRSVVEVSTGGYACVGFTESSGAGSSDVWLVRTADDGSPLWTQTYGDIEYDSGFSIQEVAAGGFIILGETSNYGLGGRDWFLIRVSSDGTFLWGHAYGRFYDDEVGSIIEVSGGDLALVGSIRAFGSHFDDADVWIMRTDYLGYEIWNYTHGGKFHDRGEDVIEVNAGGFAFVGTTYSYGAGDADVYLLRTEANGNLLWSRTYGSSGYETGQAVIEVSTGGFAIVGDVSPYGVNTRNMLLIRTDAFGNHLWNQTYGGSNYDGGYSLIEVSTGGFALVGNCQSYGAGARDLWIVRTDIDGTVLWNQTFGGVNADQGLSIIQVSSSDFVVLGTTSSYGGGANDLWLLQVTTLPITFPISFELIIVLAGTLVGVITIASVIIYRRKTT